MENQKWKEEFRKIGSGSVRFTATREEVINYISQNFIPKEEYKKILNSGRLMYQAGKDDFKAELKEWLKSQEKNKKDYVNEDPYYYRYINNHAIQSVIEYIEL